MVYEYGNYSLPTYLQLKKSHFLKHNFTVQKIGVAKIFYSLLLNQNTVKNK